MLLKDVSNQKVASLFAPPCVQRKITLKTAAVNQITVVPCYSVVQNPASQNRCLDWKCPINSAALDYRLSRFSGNSCPTIRPIHWKGPCVQRWTASTSTSPMTDSGLSMSVVEGPRRSNWAAKRSPPLRYEKMAVVEACPVNGSRRPTRLTSPQSLIVRKYWYKLYCVVFSEPRGTSLLQPRPNFSGKKQLISSTLATVYTNSVREPYMTQLEKQ